ncbi:MAG: putative S-layer protein [Nanoarchaeota archaeon]
MNKLKSLCIMVLFVVSILAVASMASAAVTINSVEVDGRDFEAGSVNTINVEKDGGIEIRVTATQNSNVTVSDVQISAYIRGNERDLVEDITDTFDMKSGVSYVKKLSLDLPLRMDQKTYTLIVRAEDNTGELQNELRFALEVDAASHAIQIKDIILSPENSVKAGRALLASVRIKNMGESSEEDLKVKVSVPELGISASDYIDELDAEGGNDDSTTSEELYLRIPDCAEAGEYTVRACVEYDDGDEEQCETTSIEVVEGDICPTVTSATTSPAAESKTIITIGPETQEIKAGGNAAYSVTLTNQGTESKSYTISADGASWATMTLTPTNVIVLSPGESKSVFVNVVADESISGDQMFSVTISSGDKVLKQVPLKASVTKEAASSGLSSIKRGLEIGLVILVVLLVVLGLIIGFNKLKGSDDDKEGKEETYY